MGKMTLAFCDKPPRIEDAPEWVHLLPGGRIIARDGRAWTLDNPDAVIDAFNRGGIDLPIDYEHQNDRAEARLSGPVPAAGWIKELANRDGALWGRVEWTERARRLIATREYRFLSPAFLFDKATGRVGRLKGAGLVHNPALQLTALAEQENMMDEEQTFLARLAAMLNLPEEASPDEILQALEDRLKQAETPDPRKYVPIEAMRDAMRQSASQTATASEERARQKVEAAFAAGYLTPAMKGWAFELCRSDHEAFDAFLAMSPPAFAHLDKTLLPKGPPQAGGRRGPQDAGALAVCAQLGLTPDQLS